MSEVVLYVPCALVTLNSERRGSRWDRARATKDVRVMALVLARNKRLPKVGRVDVVVQPWMAHRPGPLADAAAHTPTAKAALDGLVDAGVLVDDSPRWVASVTMLAPERADRDGITLTLTETKDEGDA